MDAITRRIPVALVGVIVVFACAVAGAQEESASSIPTNEGTQRHVLDGWAAQGSFHLLGKGSNGPVVDTLWGPSLSLSRLHPGGIGFDFGLTYTLPTGWERFKGIAADAAITYGFPVTPSTLLLLEGGMVAYIGVGSDFHSGDVAVRPGIAVVQHLTHPFALRVDVAANFWLGYDNWRTASARLGLLVRL